MTLTGLYMYIFTYRVVQEPIYRLKDYVVYTPHPTGRVMCSFKGLEISPQSHATIPFHNSSVTQHSKAHRAEKKQGFFLFYRFTGLVDVQIKTTKFCMCLDTAV